jgi:hypothetical protein
MYHRAHRGWEKYRENTEAASGFSESSYSQVSQNARKTQKHSITTVTAMYHRAHRGQEKYRENTEAASGPVLALEPEVLKYNPRAIRALKWGL